MKKILIVSLKTAFDCGKDIFKLQKQLYFKLYNQLYKCQIDKSFHRQV